MGIFQDEDAVFGKMRAGVDTTKHVYMEPDFKNVIQEDKHPIFYVLGVFFIILGLGALMALDYKSIIFLGNPYLKNVYKNNSIISSIFNKYLKNLFFLYIYIFFLFMFIC